MRWIAASKQSPSAVRVHIYIYMYIYTHIYIYTLESACPLRAHLILCQAADPTCIPAQYQPAPACSREQEQQEFARMQADSQTDPPTHHILYQLKSDSKDGLAQHISTSRVHTFHVLQHRICIVIRRKGLSRKAGCTVCGIFYTSATGCKHSSLLADGHCFITHSTCNHCFSAISQPSWVAFRAQLAQIMVDEEKAACDEVIRQATSAWVNATELVIE